jgi:peptidoglycan/xylan/chitin deacetylase (PgdA/CDA1 family)
MRILNAMKRHVIAPTLHAIGLYSGLSVAASRRQRVMRIVMIHAVGGTELSYNRFVKQLRILKQHFRVVPLSEIERKLRAGATPDREIALTFDDGLKNQVVDAYAALRALSLPATFFVCPAAVEEGRWLWTWECYARVRRMVPELRAEVSAELGGPAGSLAFMDWIVRLPRLEQRQARECVQSATGHFVPTMEERREFDVASWSDLESLDADLVTIGSHSSTHPMLPTLVDAELHEEVHGSRAWLERRLNRSVEYFCYPNGLSDERARAAVRDAYHAAVSTMAGVVVAASPLDALPRLAIASTAANLAWRLHRPSS